MSLFNVKKITIYEGWFENKFLRLLSYSFSLHAINIVQTQISRVALFFTHNYEEHWCICQNFYRSFLKNRNQIACPANEEIVLRLSAPFHWCRKFFWELSSMPETDESPLEPGWRFRADGQRIPNTMGDNNTGTIHIQEYFMNFSTLHHPCLIHIAQKSHLLLCLRLQKSSDLNTFRGQTGLPIPVFW